MKETILKIEPTSVTPFFQLDLKNRVMKFKGRSSPSDSRSFYYPILRKIEDLFRKKSAYSLTVNFAFEYFNTSSSKCLFDILKRLANYKLNGADVIINWFYDEYDEDMREAGEDYEDVLGVKFNYIPI